MSQLNYIELSAESGRLSSESSEVRHSSRMHADHFINDCAYGSIGLSCVAFVTEGHMVE